LLNGLTLFCLQEEAENLRGRVAALEKERADLKYFADRLETKVNLTVPSRLFFSSIFYCLWNGEEEDL